MIPEVNKKSYIIEEIKHDDGTTTLRRINDGFNEMEIIAITCIIQDDMYRLLNDREREKFNEIERIIYEAPNSPTK